jgi:hypothetical protein
MKECLIACGTSASQTTFLLIPNFAPSSHQHRKSTCHIPAPHRTKVSRSSSQRFYDTDSAFHPQHPLLAQESIANNSLLREVSKPGQRILSTQYNHFRLATTQTPRGSQPCPILETDKTTSSPCHPPPRPTAPRRPRSNGTSS